MLLETGLERLRKSPADLKVDRQRQERVFEVVRSELGDAHPGTLMVMSELAGTLQAMDDSEAARELRQRDSTLRRESRQRVLATRLRVLGDEHPETLEATSELGSTLHAEGDFVAAVELRERVLEIRRRILGDEDMGTVLAMRDLAVTRHGLGEYSRARDLLEEAVSVSKRGLGDEHEETVRAMADLAAVLLLLEGPEKARELHQEVFDIRKRTLGVEHPATCQAASNLSGLMFALGDDASADEAIREAMSARKQTKKDDDIFESLMHGGNFINGIPLEHDTDGAELGRTREVHVHAIPASIRDDRSLTIEALNDLAQMLLERDEPEAALQLQEQVLQSSALFLGGHHRLTQAARANIEAMDARKTQPL
jgi:tetratricopeptide (TPR) repeat protein